MKSNIFRSKLAGIIQRSFWDIAKQDPNLRLEPPTRQGLERFCQILIMGLGVANVFMELVQWYRVS